MFECLEQRMMLSSVPFGADPRDTNEFMLGTVYVTVALLESDGSVDPNLENWTPLQISEVKQKVREGLGWWEEMLDRQGTVHSLDFIIDFTHADSPVAIPYEPLTRPSTDVNLWVGSFLSAVGFNTGADFRTDLETFNHAQRQRFNTNWAFTIFFNNSANDADGYYADGANAWASFRGYTAIQYHRKAAVVSHEVGHIFYNLDEYPDGRSYFDRRGYYNTQNLNAFEDHPAPATRVPSIMAETRDIAFANYTSSLPSLEMIGWRDSRYPDIPQSALSDSLPDRARLDEEA